MADPSVLRGMAESEVPKEYREYRLKVIVVGAPGAGKTSIIRRYVAGSYSKVYKATVGVDFAVKVVPWDPKTKVSLQLWDIAGQERFGTMTPIYYKKAVGALIVFDVNEPRTFLAVHNWVTDIKEKLRPSDDIPILLVGNKIDTVKDGILKPFQEEQIKELVTKYNFIGWQATSAKDNINITEAVNQLLEAILSGTQEEDEDVLTLVDKPTPTGNTDTFCSCVGGGGDKSD